MFNVTRYFVILAATLIDSPPASAEVIHELTSSYHHIRVTEAGGASLAFE